MTLDWYRRAIAEIRRERPALVHCNDYNTMWIGVAAKLLVGARVVYDCHELWPDRNFRAEWRPWLIACEAVFVRAADETITASPGYAEAIARRYRTAAPRVVRNVPAWRAPARVPDESAVPVVAYFGAITGNRGLATALRALALVPRLRLRLAGPESRGYRAHLERLAEELGVDDRVEMCAPVPPDAALSVLDGASVGLALIEPACLSYSLTLPNKLFEYAAAEVPVLASEVPVLADHVRRFGVGATTDPRDPAAVAAQIQAMLDPASQRRMRAAAARLAEQATWDSERVVLADAYRRATGAAA